MYCYEASKSVFFIDNLISNNQKRVTYLMRHAFEFFAILVFGHKICSLVYPILLRLMKWPHERSLERLRRQVAAS